MITRAALYARVSTTHQEEEATIDSQIAAIESYIQAQGYELPPEGYFLDQAVSGARLDRPALDRLRHLAADGVFSAVVCYSPDRLSRIYPHQLVIMDELQRQGVRIEFVNQPELGNTPQAHLLLGVQGLFAEYERALIKERLRLGRLYKLRTGQLMPNAPPYGYRYLSLEEGGSGWVIEEREADAVRQIFIWYTGAEQLTIWAIVNRLNELYPHALRRARRWQYSIVQKILSRTAYIGYTYLNRDCIQPEIIGTPRLTGRGTRRTMQTTPRPEEEWIEVEVPALVEEAVWQRAQERLHMNHKFAARNNNRHFYLLRSLLVCGICGYTLQGRTQNGSVYYYCEYGGKNRPPDVLRHTCSIAGPLLEPLVWEAVATLLREPEQIAAAWDSESAHPSMPDEVTRLQSRQQKLQRQWVRLVDAFEEGLLDKQELSQRKDRLDQERYTLTERIEHLQRQQMHQAAKQQMMDNFAAFCEQIHESLQDPTPETKQEVLRLLVESIVVENEAITIKHIIPTDDICRLLPRGNMQKPPDSQAGDAFAALETGSADDVKTLSE